MNIQEAFRLLVYVQPIFFILINEYNLNLEKFRKTFYLTGIFTILSVYFLKLEIYPYLNQFIIIYSLMVLVLTYALNLRMNFSKALPLAFLLVFINSYIWEMPIHLISTIQNSFQDYLIQFEQSIHIYPIIYLNSKFRPGPRRYIDKLSNSWIATCIITLIRIFIVRDDFYNGLLMDFNRIISLYFTLTLFIKGFKLPEARGFTFNIFL